MSKTRKAQIQWDDHNDGEEATRGTVHIIGHTFGNIVKDGDKWHAWTKATVVFNGPVTPGRCIGEFDTAMQARDALVAVAA